MVRIGGGGSDTVVAPDLMLRRRLKHVRDAIDAQNIQRSHLTSCSVGD